jgi:hypothetical protein
MDLDLKKKISAAIKNPGFLHYKSTHIAVHELEMAVPIARAFAFQDTQTTIILLI